jgi:hypothetical protein
MTWKRCAGCTRAIAVSAFSCEYCGQLCEDVMDFLPGEEERGAAPPVDTLEPASDTERPDEAAETASIPFEWESFPGAGTAGVPASPTPSAAAPESIAEDEASSYTLDFLAEEPPASEQQAALPLDNPAAAAPIASSADIPAKPARTGMGTRQLAMVGGGVLAAGALIFTILGMRGAASPEPVVTPAPARRAPAPAPAKASTVARETPASPAKPVEVDPDAPRWSRVTDGRWVGASRQTAAFEVAATARVRVWMRDVTPVLVVRCERGRTEAFVYTQSAARMEPEDGDHTVQVAFDGASPTRQRWPDSAEHDALFARNPLEFTRQLTQARTLQFGFTPHNADTAVATFVLDGLEPLLASSAKPCGWK